jgi:hypothetical protein
MINYKRELHTQKRGDKYTCIKLLDEYNKHMDRETLLSFLAQQYGPKLTAVTRTPDEIHTVWSRLRRAQTRRALIAKTIVEEFRLRLAEHDESTTVVLAPQQLLVGQETVERPANCT